MVATIDTAPTQVRPTMTGALAEVERRFSEQLSLLRLFPGAALAIYRQGRLVLDLAGGYADTQRGRAGRARTRSSSSSPARKPFAAVALWQQIERGERSSTTRSPRTGRRSPKRARTRVTGPACPLPPWRLPD